LAGFISPWAPKIILAYLLYITIIYFVIINASQVNFNAYSLTNDQKAILSSQNNDALTFLNKLYTLSTLSTTYAFVSTVTFIFSAAFLIALAYIIRNLLPIP
jgi:hypothetical protein